MKDNIEFYQHQANADVNPKFIMLRNRYGWAGDGRFWALNNRIAQASNCVLNINKKFVKAGLIHDLSLEEDELDEFINYLSEECELIKITEAGITTNDVQDTLRRVSSERGRKRGKSAEHTHIPSAEHTHILSAELSDISPEAPQLSKKQRAPVSETSNNSTENGGAFNNFPRQTLATAAEPPRNLHGTSTEPPRNLSHSIVEYSKEEDRKEKKPQTPEGPVVCHPAFSSVDGFETWWLDWKKSIWRGTGGTRKVASGYYSKLRKKLSDQEIRNGTIRYMQACRQGDTPHRDAEGFLNPKNGLVEQWLTESPPELNGIPQPVRLQQKKLSAAAMREMQNEENIKKVFGNGKA